MQPGPATGKVRALLEPYREDLLPGALEGYALPRSDGTSRNRKNLRRAVALLAEAGWQVRDGVLKNADGKPLELSVLLRQGDAQMKTVVEIYGRALERLGITLTPELVDNAQYVMRQTEFDFDLTRIRRELSLSPGNEQRLYWGQTGAHQPGSRNLMGIESPAVEAMIDHMLTAQSAEDFTAAVRSLDRVLVSGRYVIPIWQYDRGRIAHVKALRHPQTTPIYGDRSGFFPDVWWYQPD